GIRDDDIAVLLEESMIGRAQDRHRFSCVSAKASTKDTKGTKNTKFEAKGKEGEIGLPLCVFLSSSSSFCASCSLCPLWFALLNSFLVWPSQSKYQKGS